MRATDSEREKQKEDIIRQVEVFQEDDEVIDFILSINDETIRSDIFKALDSNKGLDMMLPLTIPDSSKPFVRVYHLIVRSAHEHEGGLILYTSLNHEAIIQYLRYSMEDNVTSEFKDRFLRMLEQTAINLRNMAAS